MCLHDADVLLREEHEEPFGPLPTKEWPGPWPLVPWYAVFRFGVLLGDEAITLLYFLSDHVSERPAMPDWPFSKGREHLLYDELHCASADHGRFVHNVLLSSGIMLSIPFSAVLITRFAVPQGKTTELSARTA